MIVVRHSPDWLRFDVAESRAFCASAGMPPDTVVEFSAVWDRTLTIGYREFRHEVKRIALDNFAAVRGAAVLDDRALDVAALADDALIAFVDDDDWFDPALFETLAREPPHPEGYTWASFRLGHDFPGEHVARRERGIVYRPVERFIYSNNYALRASFLKARRLADYFEHGRAHLQMTAGAFDPALVPRYLSFINKHPASTMAAHAFTTSGAFWQDPRAAFERAFADAEQLEVTDHALGWMDEPLRRYKELVRRIAYRPAARG